MNCNTRTSGAHCSLRKVCSFGITTAAYSDPAILAEDNTATTLRSWRRPSSNSFCSSESRTSFTTTCFPLEHRVPSQMRRFYGTNQHHTSCLKHLRGQNEYGTQQGDDTHGFCNHASLANDAGKRAAGGRKRHNTLQRCSDEVIVRKRRR